VSKVYFVGRTQRPEQVLSSRLWLQEAQVVGWISWPTSIARACKEVTYGHSHHQVCTLLPVLFWKWCCLPDNKFSVYCAGFCPFKYFMLQLIQLIFWKDWKYVKCLFCFLFWFIYWLNYLTV